MSERGVSGSPASSSGETYAGDEVTGRPASSESARRAAIPKSERYAFPSSSSRTFAGLTSRWTTPCRWA